MAFNELIGLLAATDLSGLGGRSILDQPLRSILLRAVGSRPDLARPWAEPHVPDRGGTALETALASLDSGRTDPYDIDLVVSLERERSDVASVARFGHRVESASYHMYVAFEKAGVDDFELLPARDVVKPARGISIWYCSLVNTTFNHYSNLRRALLHQWTPPFEVEPLTSNAFRMLCGITPADSQLRNLFVHDRPRAFHELAHHLDIVAEQLKAAIELATDLRTVASDEKSREEQVRLQAVQAEVLRKAGEALSLTAAAQRLGVSRQALHKRIQSGSALGLMRGSELVVPAAQFVSKNGKIEIVDNLSAIVTLFDKSGAGRWSALQFLIEVDPLLGKVPFDALKAGEPDAVGRAARAFLSLDEA